MKRVVASGMVGNGLEWYDFALYGIYATIIKDHFFPTDDAFTGYMLTYGAFAAGFLMRPFGAILFGWIGDKYGRKISLAIAILMMAFPTAMIGLLPTYETIGIAAPILLTMIRLAQGLSLGGEFAGSITFIVEHSKDHRRGLAGSACVISLVAGMLLGSIVATIMSSLLSEADLKEWGWRIPFLGGILIGLVGFYIRHHTTESPKYSAAKRKGQLSETPVADAFTKYPREMLTGIGLYLSVTVPFYIFSVFMIKFYSDHLKRPLQDALEINMIGMFLLLLIVPFSAWLSDKIGRRKVMTAAAIGYLVFAYPIFYMTINGDYTISLIAMVLFAIILGMYIAPIPAVLVELFPTSVRYTGMAISYNICAALFGGTAPLVATWLIQKTGFNTIVAFYIMLCAIVTLFTLSHFKDKYRAKID